MYKWLQYKTESVIFDKLGVQRKDFMAPGKYHDFAIQIDISKNKQTNKQTKKPKLQEDTANLFRW